MGGGALGEGLFWYDEEMDVMMYAQDPFEDSSNTRDRSGTNCTSGRGWTTGDWGLCTREGMHGVLATGTDDMAGDVGLHFFRNSKIDLKFHSTENSRSRWIRLCLTTSRSALEERLGLRTGLPIHDDGLESCTR